MHFPSLHYINHLIYHLIIIIQYHLSSYLLSTQVITYLYPNTNLKVILTLEYTHSYHFISY